MIAYLRGLGDDFAGRRNPILGSKDTLDPEIVISHLEESIAMGHLPPRFATGSCFFD